jgi:hypothetical protein
MLPLVGTDQGGITAAMSSDRLSLSQIRARQRRKGAKEKVKVLRQYADFARGIDLRKKLSGKQLRKIEDAFSEYTDLTSRPHKVIRARNSNNLKALQAFSQHSGETKFKVAFVPTADIDARVSVRSGKVVIRNKYVIQRFSPFNMRELATNPNAEITRAIKAHPKARRFIIKTGEYYYNGPMPENKVMDTLLEFMQRYSPGGKPYERRGENSHYQNWMIGLETYEYANQDDLDEYVMTRERQRRAVLREKGNERARYRKYYGKRVNVLKHK